MDKDVHHKLLNVHHLLVHKLLVPLSSVIQENKNVLELHLQMLTVLLEFALITLHQQQIQNVKIS